MSQLDRTLLLAVAGINVVTFVVYGWDKWRARRGGRRVPEAHLLWLAAVTGAIGAWTAMTLFRHKTRKRSFRRWLVLATAWNGVWVWLWLQMRG
jgi:uncharacterized membrane protein YsdA (DUF1294 family)